ADQFVIDLLRNRPPRRIDFLPTRFKLLKILPMLVDTRSRPIPHSAVPFHSIYVIAGKRRVFRSPHPEIVGEFAERLCLRGRQMPWREQNEYQRDAFVQDHVRSVLNRFSASNRSIASSISLSINSV